MKPDGEKPAAVLTYEAFEAQKKARREEAIAAVRKNMPDLDQSKKAWRLGRATALEKFIVVHAPHFEKSETKRNTYRRYLRFLDDLAELIVDIVEEFKTPPPIKRNRRGTHIGRPPHVKP